MAAKIKKPKTVKVARSVKIPAPAEDKSAAYVIPEPNLPKPAEGDTTAFLRQEAARYDGDTSIRLYLREIGQVKLLTPDEEIQLAARIKKGDKKAREHMIKANLRLVVKIARDYEGIGLPLLDLISEGNIGLMKAVERFDPAKGGKLSTYGSWWIKQSIKRALANQSKTIRLPVHLVDKISKMRRTAMKLQEMLGHEPSDEELADEMGMTAARITQMRQAAVRPASLDAPIGDDDSNNFADVVQDENATSPYDNLEDKTVVNMLQDMVKHLDEREATILRFPFRPRRRLGKNIGGSRREIRRHARARPPDPESCAEKTPQDDRKTGEGEKQGGMILCRTSRPPKSPPPSATSRIFPSPASSSRTSRPCWPTRGCSPARLTCSRKNSSPAKWMPWLGLTPAGLFSPPPPL